VSESFYVNISFSGPVVLQKTLKVFSLYEYSVIGLLVLEKIFKYFQYIFIVSLLSPLGEGGCPSYEQF
jgi:hypothetical protein